VKDKTHSNARGYSKTTAGFPNPLLHYPNLPASCASGVRRMLTGINLVNASSKKCRRN